MESELRNSCSSNLSSPTISSSTSSGGTTDPAKSPGHATNSSSSKMAKEDERYKKSCSGNDRQEGAASLTEEEAQAEVDAQREFYSTMKAAGRADFDGEEEEADVASSKQAAAGKAAMDTTLTVGVGVGVDVNFETSFPRRSQSRTLSSTHSAAARESNDQIQPQDARRSATTSSAPEGQQPSPRHSLEPGAYDTRPGRRPTRLPSVATLSAPDQQQDQQEEEAEEEGQQRLNTERSDNAVAIGLPTMDCPASRDADVDTTTSSIATASAERRPFSREGADADLEANVPPPAGDGDHLIEAQRVDDLVVEAEPVALEKWTPKRITWLVLGSLALLAIIIGTATGLGLRVSDDPEKDLVSSTLAPTLSPEVRLETLSKIILSSSLSTLALEITSTNTTGTSEEVSEEVALSVVLEDPTSPQFKALQWIASDDAHKVPVDDVDHILQRFALAVLFYSTGGENWTDAFEFLRPSHECTWSGALLCNKTTITGIVLVGNELSGQLPKELSLLTSLQSIAMDDNHLTGPLPSMLSPKLQRLDLRNNELEGSIPSSYGQMEYLESFCIGSNKLIGTIPEDVGSLTRLTSLSLESNALSGRIPDSIWNLNRMQDFQIGQQSLTGTLSPLVGAWTDATIFHMNKLNGITGSIPSEFGMLEKLTSLKFSQNHLRGTLPTELGNLQNMELLAISRNGISGTVPTEFARLTNAKEIYLQNTWIEGDVGSICQAKENGLLPELNAFNMDMEEVNCTCCACCEY